MDRNLSVPGALPLAIDVEDPDVEDFDVDIDLPRLLNSVLGKAEYICQHVQYFENYRLLRVYKST